MSRKVLIDAIFASDVASCLESEGYDFSANAIRAALEAPQPGDSSSIRELAENIMTDCGCSTQYDDLREKIEARLWKHFDAAMGK